MSARGIHLPGWTCKCGTFNGAAKEWLKNCRHCGKSYMETKMQEVTWLTVGELKKKLAQLPEDMRVVLEISGDDMDDILQAPLQKAFMEARCDEVDTLFLWGDADGDDSE
jgi:hypothetical protein